LPLEDEGKVLGIEDGTWQKIHMGSGQKGTIERTKSVTWNPLLNPPSVSFDLPSLGYTVHKISDSTPSKENLLSASYNIVGGDLAIYTPRLVDSDIMVDTKDVVAFQFSANPGYGYLVAYSKGDFVVEVQDVELTMNIPEAGFYQIWIIG
jgi:hypothetical protein